MDARSRVSGLPPITQVIKQNLTSDAAQRRDSISLGSYTAADYYVESLPGLENMASHPTHPLHLFAGNLPSIPVTLDGNISTIFFLMAKARRSAGKDRVIFWFNGGPGCSSFDGSLMEVGPFRTVPASQTASGQVEQRLVEGGWEEFATIVFIDQPPGTGFSTVSTDGYLHELDEASTHLIHFMSNFYHTFPEYKSADTYLAGESFAGQYIPYFADALIKTDLLPGFNLKGLAIGNGWIDPRAQYRGYVDFAYEKGLFKQGSSEGLAAEKAWENCKTRLDGYEDKDLPVNVDQCGGVMDAVSEPFTQTLNGKKVCMNIYDTRLVDDWPACGMNWPPDLSDVYTFLREKSNVQALHADLKATAWVECNNQVSSQLYLRSTPASVNLLPGILEAGVPIMMFAGAEDLICNYKGLEMMMDRIEWGGATGFGNATKDEWIVNGTSAGTWQTARNLTYVKIFGASHMVGVDAPGPSTDMMLRFMDIDYSLVAGTAEADSSLGGVDRFGLHYGTKHSAAEDVVAKPSTDWAAWYNAFSALAIVIALVGFVGLYFFFRARGRYRRARPSGAIGLRNAVDEDAAERVPLGTERVELNDLEEGSYHDSAKSKGKGKARDTDSPSEVMFELGDDDDDDDAHVQKGR